MKVNIVDIPFDKTVDDYPDDTIFVLNDKPAKYDLKTGERVLPGDPKYDELPLINISTGKIIENQ